MLYIIYKIYLHIKYIYFIECLSIISIYNKRKRQRDRETERGFHILIFPGLGV